MSQKVLLQPAFPPNESDKAWDPVNNPVGTFTIDGTATRMEVIGMLKGGKEATVYCCEAQGPRENYLVAAKQYRDLSFRQFKNDAVYQQGRWFGGGRRERAFRNKSRFGRAVQFGGWVEHEYQTLKALHAAGADVPRPFGRSGSIVLMEYLGDKENAAPMLSRTVLPPDEAKRLFDVVMRNIRLFLSLDCVHADLSPFNILYWQGTVKIIDLPQAVDPRSNPNAFDLLTRDVENVCRYFFRYGIGDAAPLLAQELWQQYLRAKL
jgi:RIO kinase 1